MDDLAKKKLNTEEMNIWFIRLNRSIENTAKKILREKYPLPEDNPLDFENRTAVTGDMKKKRDDELAKFLKEVLTKKGPNVNQFAKRRTWGPTPNYPNVEAYAPTKEQSERKLTVIAGPCSVENPEQIHSIALCCKAFRRDTFARRRLSRRHLPW
ncbi:MAG: hypothetical protein IPK80_02055 [Nannocystis sp.]|nr:hypothetical protein [Nannocystis sp.]